MSTMSSQITSLTRVYSTVYSIRKSKETSKLRVTGLCARNSPVTGEFPAQMASNAENVSIWWRHHATWYDTGLKMTTWYGTDLNSAPWEGKLPACTRVEYEGWCNSKYGHLVRCRPKYDHVAYGTSLNITTFMTKIKKIHICVFLCLFQICIGLHNPMWYMLILSHITNHS